MGNNDTFILVSIIALWVLAIYMITRKSPSDDYYTPSQSVTTSAEPSPDIEHFTATAKLYSKEDVPEGYVPPEYTTSDVNAGSAPYTQYNTSMVRSGQCIYGPESSPMCYDGQIPTSGSLLRNTMLTEDSLIPYLSSNVGKLSYDIRGTYDVPITYAPTTVSSKPQV
jgi:hypothetical protein